MRLSELKPGQTGVITKILGHGAFRKRVMEMGFVYRKFKELEQLSPNDFIKYQRISYAARLLLTTSATVQEILYRSGFTNRSHFYKEFDKRFGMTPKAYRDANVKKDTSLENNRKPKD